MIELEKLNNMKRYAILAACTLVSGAMATALVAEDALMDGNPLEDITVIGGSELWMKAPIRSAGVGIEPMKFIMKDGRIYKTRSANRAEQEDVEIAPQGNRWLIKTIFVGTIH